ncbi:MAG: DUF1203 domain-containing protein [Pseudomonadota bacterium]
MTFQILPLDSEQFQFLSELSDEELAARHIDRKVVTQFPGSPCRVTLDDAEVGETVYLLNWQHLEEDTPYRAAHAIYVRPDRKAEMPEVDALPPVLLRRPISVRGYDERHRMIAADLAEGPALEGAIKEMFGNKDISYIHLHNAKPGCFAAKAVRA